MNSSLLNTFQLNAELAPSASLYTPSEHDSIEFDGYSLQSTSIITRKLEAFSAPTREIVTYKVPRNDGGRLNGAYFRDRVIHIEATARASTASAMEDLIDEIKRRLSVVEGFFDMKVNGATRRIRATLQNSGQMFSEREGYHITYCPLILDFLALDPFFHDTEYTSYTTESSTSLSLAQTVENFGTAYARPIVTVIVEAASSVTGISFENQTNGKYISVTQALNPGDIIVIDSENSTVTINGSSVDYEGLFPTLEYGSNDCIIETQGSSIQLTATIKYLQAYL